MKRYSPEIGYDCSDEVYAYIDIKEDPDGEYLRVSEVRTLLREALENINLAIRITGKSTVGLNNTTENLEKILKELE